MRKVEVISAFERRHISARGESKGSSDVVFGAKLKLFATPVVFFRKRQNMKRGAKKHLYLLDKALGDSESLPSFDTRLIFVDSCQS